MRACRNPFLLLPLVRTRGGRSESTTRPTRSAPLLSVEQPCPWQHELAAVAAQTQALAPLPAACLAQPLRTGVPLQAATRRVMRQRPHLCMASLWLASFRRFNDQPPPMYQCWRYVARAGPLTSCRSLHLHMVRLSHLGPQMLHFLHVAERAGVLDAETRNKFKHLTMVFAVHNLAYGRDEGLVAFERVLAASSDPLVMIVPFDG